MSGAQMVANGGDGRTFSEMANNYSEFCVRTEEYLRTEGQRRLSALLDGAPAESVYWHHTGFLVYRLGLVPGIGNLRLHIWLDTPRISREGVDGPHDHIWHLQSMIVGGIYEEEVLDVVEAAGDDTDYEPYLFDYSNPDGLHPTGERVGLKVRERELYREGQVHHLPAGDVHSTIIPDDRFCMTLCIFGADHYLGATRIFERPGHGVLPRIRPYLDEPEARDFLSQVEHRFMALT